MVFKTFSLTHRARVLNGEPVCASCGSERLDYDPVYSPKKRYNGVSVNVQTVYCNQCPIFFYLVTDRSTGALIDVVDVVDAGDGFNAEQ